jgi:hypothetical protein
LLAEIRDIFLPLVINLTLVLSLCTIPLQVILEEVTMSKSKFEIHPKHLINTGRALSILGTGLLITEVIAGIFALDVAILICIMREENRNRGRLGFFSGYLWGQMSRNHGCLVGNNLLVVAIASFAQSLIAGVLLAVEFGMPIIALGILGAWLASVALIASGQALQNYGLKLSLKREDYPAEFDLPNDVNARAFAPSAPPI